MPGKKQKALPTQLACSQGQAIAEVLDLADLHSVQALASRLQQESRLDMLIFNAGVMACPLGYTAQGFEMQIGTNHFGHFLLFQLLEAKLAAQAALVSGLPGVYHIPNSASSRLWWNNLFVLAGMWSDHGCCKLQRKRWSSLKIDPQQH